MFPYLLFRVLFRIFAFFCPVFEQNEFQFIFIEYFWRLDLGKRLLVFKAIQELVVLGVVGYRVLLVIGVLEDAGVCLLVGFRGFEDTSTDVVNGEVFVGGFFGLFGFALSVFACSLTQIQVAIDSSAFFVSSLFLFIDRFQNIASRKVIGIVFFYVVRIRATRLERVDLVLLVPRGLFPGVSNSLYLIFFGFVAFLIGLRLLIDIEGFLLGFSSSSRSAILFLFSLLSAFYLPVLGHAQKILFFHFLSIKQRQQIQIDILGPRLFRLPLIASNRRPFPTPPHLALLLLIRLHFASDIDPLRLQTLDIVPLLHQKMLPIGNLASLPRLRVHPRVILHCNLQVFPEEILAQLVLELVEVEDVFVQGLRAVDLFVDLRHAFQVVVLDLEFFVFLDYFFEFVVVFVLVSRQLARVLFDVLQTLVDLVELQDQVVLLEVSPDAFFRGRRLPLLGLLAAFVRPVDHLRVSLDSLQKLLQDINFLHFEAQFRILRSPLPRADAVDRRLPLLDDHGVLAGVISIIPHPKQTLPSRPRLPPVFRRKAHHVLFHALVDPIVLVAHSKQVLLVFLQRVPFEHFVFLGLHQIVVVQFDVPENGVCLHLICGESVFAD